MAFGAITAQSNKMSVMQAPQELHFFAKLLLPLHGALVHALHRRHQAILEPGLVHGAQPTPPYDGAEVVRGSLDLREPDVCEE